MRRRDLIGTSLCAAAFAGAAKADTVSPAIVGKANPARVPLSDYLASGSSDWTNAFTRAIAASDERRDAEAIAAAPASETSLFGPAIILPHGTVHLEAAGFKVKNAIRVLGEDMSICRVTLPRGEYFIDTDENILNLGLSGVTFTGGRGAVMLRNTNNFTRGSYVVHRCAFNNFSDAAICNLSDDFGRWNISGNHFWAGRSDAGKVLGIGIALRGAQDNSVISENLFHRVGFGIKVRSPAVCWIYHNSFLRNGSVEERGPGVDIWITAEDSPEDRTQCRGCQIYENRHGNENSGPGDEIMLIAAEDPSSGADFGTRMPMRAPANLEIKGLICERNYAEGGGHPRPYATSWLTRISASVFSNQLGAGMAGEVIYGRGVRPMETPHHPNLLSTRYWGLIPMKASPEVPPGWILDDPLNRLRRN